LEELVPLLGARSHHQALTKPEPYATCVIHIIKEAQQDQADDPQTKAIAFDLLDILFTSC
jgi:hypothetical protein